jgi:HEAT repeat protein
VAVPVLIEALGYWDWTIRRAACEALGEIGDASAVPALIKALGYWDWTIRRAACEALGEIGDASAVPALIKALGDRNGKVRRAACVALKQIGIASAVSVLIAALGNGLVRWAASAALVQIGEPAVPHLKKAMESAPPDIRERVQRVLERIEQRKRWPRWSAGR